MSGNSGAPAPRPEPKPAEDDLADIEQATPATKAEFDQHAETLAKERADAQLQEHLEGKEAAQPPEGSPLPQSGIVRPGEVTNGHSEAYLVARKVVHAAVEACDTRPGKVAQVFVPAAAAACTTAYTLNHLDQSYDSHLLNDSKGVRKGLTEAGRDIVGHLGKSYSDAATSVVDAVSKYNKSANEPKSSDEKDDKLTVKDHLREAAIEATSVAVGGKASILINPILTKVVDKTPFGKADPNDASKGPQEKAEAVAQEPAPSTSDETKVASEATEQPKRPAPRGLSSQFMALLSTGSGESNRNKLPAPSPFRARP